MFLLDILFGTKIKSEKIIQKMEKGKPVSIVCFGDSITWGYELKSYITSKKTRDNYPKILEDLLRKHYKNEKIEVLNEGHVGWTAKKAIQNKDGLSKVLKIKSDLVILMFGINEVISLPRINIDTYKESIDFIIKSLKGNKTEILLLSPTPINIMDRALSKYASVVSEIAKENGIYFLDMRSLILDYIKENNLKKYNIVAIDNAHFWASKYKIISEILLNRFFK